MAKGEILRGEFRAHLLEGVFHLKVVPLITEQTNIARNTAEAAGSQVGTRKETCAS